MIRATATLVRSPNLSQFLDSTLSPAVRKSVESACQIIQQSAQGYCPVDTGALRDSITVSVVQVALQSVQGRVGPHMPYAEYVEYGTGRAGDPTAPYPHVETWHGMVAQPYMRPAYDENKAAITDLFRDTLKTALEH